MNDSHRVALSTLVALCLAAPVCAQPTVEMYMESGDEPALKFTYAVQYPQLRGSEPTLSAINRALRDLALGPVNSMRSTLEFELAHQPGGVAGQDTRDAFVMVGAGLLSERVFSASLLASTQSSDGDSHEDQAGVTFDLSTGRRLRGRDLYAAGSKDRVKQVVARAMREAYPNGEFAEPKTLGAAFAGEQGLTFLWGEGILASPAAGAPSVTVPYADLRGLLNEDLFGDLAQAADAGLPLPQLGAPAAPAAPAARFGLVSQDTQVLQVYPATSTTVVASLPQGAVVTREGASSGQPGVIVIQLPDGRLGRIPASRFEAVGTFADVGRVYRVNVGDALPRRTVYRFGSVDGPELLARAGAGHPDTQLEALIALVGEDGMSEPLYLDGVETQIDTRAGIAVIGFDPVEPDLAGGEPQLGSSTPAPGSGAGATDVLEGLGGQ